MATPWSRSHVPVDPKSDTGLLPDPVASPKAGRARSILWYGLAVLWLVNAILQAQPGMFSPDFYAVYPAGIMPSLLQQAAQGQPGWLARLLLGADGVWGHHPILFNIGAIVLQAAIAFGLLVGYRRRIGRWAIVASLVWAGVVWLFGEGLGGILTVGATALSGGPGSAWFYMVLSGILLWNRVTGTALRKSIGAFWLVAGAWQALPLAGGWDGNTFLNLFANAAALPQPDVLAKPIGTLALWSAGHGNVFNAVLSLWMMVLGLVMMKKSWPRWTLAVALSWYFFIWWFGQDFGGTFTGLTTDLNSGPVLGLLTISAAMWGRRAVRVSPVYL